MIRSLATCAACSAYQWKVIDRIPAIRKLDNERSRDFVLSRQQETNYLEAALHR